MDDKVIFDLNSRSQIHVSLEQNLKQSAQGNSLQFKMYEFQHDQRPCIATSSLSLWGILLMLSLLRVLVSATLNRMIQDVSSALFIHEYSWIHQDLREPPLN